MSTEPTLEDVKFVDVETKRFVNGYVREVEVLLPGDNVYYTIPTLIIHWIILYFYQMEQFDANYCHKDIILSDDNKIATTNNRWHLAAMLQKVVKSGMHCWKFRFPDHDYIAFFGVYKHKYISSWEELQGNDPQDGDYKGKLYAMASDLRATYGDTEDITIVKGDYATGDRIIEMILDLDKRELRYKMNDIDYGAVFTNIEETSYKAFVSGWTTGQTFEILSYKACITKD